MAPGNALFELPPKEYAEIAYTYGIDAHDFLRTLTRDAVDSLITQLDNIVGPENWIKIPKPKNRAFTEKDLSKVIRPGISLNEEQKQKLLACLNTPNRLSVSIKRGITENSVLITTLDIPVQYKTNDKKTSTFAEGSKKELSLSIYLPTEHKDKALQEIYLLTEIKPLKNAKIPMDDIECLKKENRFLIQYNRKNKPTYVALAYPGRTLERLIGSRTTPENMDAFLINFTLSYLKNSAHLNSQGVSNADCNATNILVMQDGTTFLIDNVTEIFKKSPAEELNYLNRENDVCLEKIITLIRDLFSCYASKGGLDNTRYQYFFEKHHLTEIADIRNLTKEVSSRGDNLVTPKDAIKIFIYALKANFPDIHAKNIDLLKEEIQENLHTQNNYAPNFKKICTETSRPA